MFATKKWNTPNKNDIYAIKGVLSLNEFTYVIYINPTAKYICVIFPKYNAVTPIVIAVSSYTILMHSLLFVQFALNKSE